VTPEIRPPAVAGRFYPSNPERLTLELERYLAPAPGAQSDAAAVVAPHAGWMYSGAIAGQTYARIRVPQSVVVLCPNHTGLGARRSIWCAGAWRLPGGDVTIDAELAERVRELAGLEDDRLAHAREHAIEVHLPFLRAKNPSFVCVPICLSRLTLADCKKVGEGLARALDQLRPRPLLVASTDMSHYISAEAAEKLDRLALDRVEALDPEGLYEVVTGRDISMCGYIPTTVTLFAVRALGAKRAELVRYGNSGETSGDFEQVVGYAGLVIE
jgi:AmmeMemoRadiSam system protein B